VTTKSKKATAEATPEEAPAPEQAPEEAAPAEDAPAPADAPPEAPKVEPVVVDNKNRRSGDDALTGGWVEIKTGHNQGKYGTFIQSVETDSTGYPTKILVKLRDYAGTDEYEVLPYEDAVATSYVGGR
jgi:hypothetical protein